MRPECNSLCRIRLLTDIRQHARTALLAVHVLNFPWLRWPAGYSAELPHTRVGRGTATFRIRRVGDELAYVHDIGLALMGSDRRRQGKDWVHETQSRLFKGSVSLGDAASDLPFFRLFQPGARILRNGTPVPIETWGASLAGLGAAVEAIEKVAGVIGLNLGELYLDHLRNEEFNHSLGFLEALFIKKVPAERLIPAFIVDSGEDRDTDDISQLKQ